MLIWFPNRNSAGAAGEQNFADFESAFSQMNIQTGAGSPISSTGIYSVIILLAEQ